MKWTTILSSVFIITVVFFTLIFFNILPIQIIPLENICISDKNCELSLCSCECHITGETPEETKGIVCGKNCLEWYNVSGCECRNFKCKEIMV